MMTQRFEPAIGQRFVHRLSGVSDKVWVITAICSPTLLQESCELIFTEEVSHRVIRHTPIHVAQMTLEGKLYQQHLISDVVESKPVALTDLIMKMSDGQRQRFKMRVSYVQVLEKHSVGFSVKSKAFCELIFSHHENRLLAHKAMQEAKPDRRPTWIEPKPPSPTSVYRWYLRYRKSGNDMRVLAQEAIATRTRSARKPKEQELLAAFLTNRMSVIGTQSVAALTHDFNRLLEQTDPLRFDELIENLYIDGVNKAKQNQAAKRGKSSLRKR